MSEIRKCSRCKAEIPEESKFKVCLECRTARKQNYKLKSAKTEIEKQSKKLLKALDPSATPEYFKSYAEYQKHCKLMGFSKPTFDSYQQALRDLKEGQLETQQRKLKNQFAERRLYNSRFLNFDLFGFTEKSKCKAYRLSVMENLKDNRLTLHVSECSPCQMWQDDFNAGILNAEYTSEIWQRPQNDTINIKPVISKSCYFFRKAYLNNDKSRGLYHQKHVLESHCESCKQWLLEMRISQGELKRPTTFEEYEKWIGLEDFDPEGE